MLAATNEAIGTGPLRDWLNGVVPEPVSTVDLEKFAGGQSNPTYRLRTDRGDFVLRRKPFGTLLPKAHMIEREVKVLRALGASDVPVPKVYGLCEDPSVIGASFYVMEMVEGRIFWDPRLPDVPPVQRTAMFDAMNDAVARLHELDVSAAGLSGFGRAEGFMQRQIKLWTAQYHASRTIDIPAMDALIEWLPRNAPETSGASVFHGDLRFDNLILHPTEPKVLAILDWELSTIGDAIADFAYNMIVWRIPPELFRGLAGVDFAGLGIPNEEAYKAAYCRRRGLDTLPHWPFYLAFGLFRVAAILQGVARRAQDGNASAEDAAQLGAKAAPLADIGWEIACNG